MPDTCLGILLILHVSGSVKTVILPSMILLWPISTIRYWVKAVELDHDMPHAAAG
jgi:hypothetical protein